MVTGYERQHRKQFSCQSINGSDPQTTDQYTKLLIAEANRQGIHEQKSRAKEQACVTGMVLLQPYLDFKGSDPAQGELKVKLWEYNSFLVDPFARESDFSDAQFIWTQEYISKKEAEFRFPDKYQTVAPMSGTPQRYGSFYFLPENYNMARNDLMVLSYVWYKWKRKRKKLYSRSMNMFFDIAQDESNIDAVLYNIPDMELVELEVPTWKLAVVLNDQLMFQGDNPLGFDDCPFVPYFWNYEPHNNYYDLRVRGLVRTMRDSNYLLNRRIIINHDISEATINAGWIRKSGAVANEDNLKKSGQGWDIIVNEGYELSDVQKIMPSSVPESDMALADQLQSLIFSTSGVNIESWSAENSPNASSLTVLMKQAANLMVLQKYFDQWDLADKILGERMLQIMLNNWNAQKVRLLLGEDPSPFFFSKIFSKFNVMMEEADLTPTQQNLQARQMMDMNQAFGREVFPPSMIIPKLNITGKAEIIEFLKQQEQQAAAVQSEATNLQHAFQDAQLKDLQSRAVNNMASAKERYGRYESDLGLKDERESELTKNRALATKAKMEALDKMVDVTAKLGAVETMIKLGEIDAMQDLDIAKEDMETNKSQQEANRTEFMDKILSGLPGLQKTQNSYPMQQEQNLEGPMQ